MNWKTLAEKWLRTAPPIGVLILTAWMWAPHSKRPPAQSHAPIERIIDDESAVASRLAPFNTNELRVPASEIISGGPGKDGIPALSQPKTTRASLVGFLTPEDRVIAVRVDGQQRAYPLRVLNWHEVINDQLGDTPIAVIYCPLCDSVSVVDRRIDGQTLTFGVSGLLYNSNVLTYDQQHLGLWSQVGLTAVSGPYAGRSLKHIPWQIMRFDAWQAQHPQSAVVNLETGHRREYRHNPYHPYFTDHRLMFPVASRDERLALKTPVIGVRLGRVARAYPIKQIAQQAEGRVEDRIDGHRLVITHDASSGGIAVEQAPELAGFVHTFWFAWAAMHPDTTIYRGGQPLPGSGPPPLVGP